MSVGVPGGYRFMSWRPRYTPELAAALLPTVWGFGISGEIEVGTDRCKQGKSECTHACELDQWDEGCVVDGDYRDCAHRHGGHSQCGKCVCVAPASRRTNDNRESDMAAMRIDIARAWRLAIVDYQIRRALYLRHAMDRTERQIAEDFGVTQQTISLRLAAGHGALADFLNGRQL